MVGFDPSFTLSVSARCLIFVLMSVMISCFFDEILKGPFPLKVFEHLFLKAG